MPSQTATSCRPLARSVLLLSMLAVLPPAAWAQQPEQDAGFSGWEAMRVIEQEGWPMRMTAADLDADGRDELIVVNTRNARLDIYRHRTPSERAEPGSPPSDQPGAQRPNELPMAQDFQRVEVPLEYLPIAALAHDVDGEAGLELIVLIASPQRIVVLRAEQGLDYEKSRSVDLLAGDYAGRNPLLLDDATTPPTIMVSMAQGIQQIEMPSLDPQQPAPKPTWYAPKQQINRIDWWLGDMDGDGDTDLVSWTNDADRALRWYERSDGRFAPPQTLHDRLVDQAHVIRAASGNGEVMLLGGVHSGLLRRFALGVGEQGPLGGREALALDAADNAPWCGVTVEDAPTLVAVDKEQPRLRTFRLTETGWSAGPTYPITAQVEQVEPLHAQPGVLLLRAKEAGRLLISRWDGSRFTYPKPWDAAAYAAADAQAQDEGDDDASQDAGDEEDRAVLGLGNAGSTTWWAQRVGEDVLLYTWPADAPEPQATRFEALGKKVDKAAWLGGQRLLIMEQYARQPALAWLDDGRVERSESAHLKTIKPEDVRLIQIDGQRRPARLTEGVLQWLDDQLHPEDQVMLPEGARLTSFVPTGDGGAWALEAGGERVHLMRTDEGGVYRVEETHRLPGGVRLIDDPVLGLLLIDSDAVTRLTPGQAREMELLQSIDSREGRPSGVREATIHRIDALDVQGDGVDELVLHDDMRHQITLLSYEGDQMKAALSWPVFEDAKYPYGYDENNMVREPRALVALDIDGDGNRDLALLTHDRLILYLGEDRP